MKLRTCLNRWRIGFLSLFPLDLAIFLGLVDNYALRKIVKTNKKMLLKSLSPHPLRQVLIPFALALFSLCFELDASCFDIPETLVDEEIRAIQQEGQLDMTWNFDEAGEYYFRFQTEKEEAYLELFFKENSFDDLLKDSFYFTYLLDSEGNSFSYPPLRTLTYGSPNASSYLVHERRVLKDKPQEVGVDFLKECLKNNRVAFYTGAGISAASGVPTMHQLENLLGFEEGETFLDVFKQVVLEPKKIAENVLEFHRACFEKKPTAAHLIIADLSQRYGIPVITENLDVLHEASGILPYRIVAEEVRETVTQEEACSIDYIICVGLSHDDRGFLGWYKSLNSDGKILSIDLNSPSYLGEEDFLLKGDLQSILLTAAKDLLTIMF